MRFKINYIEQFTSENPKPQWKTVDADSLPEADKIARKWRPRGYIINSVVQDLTYDL